MSASASWGLVGRDDELRRIDGFLDEAAERSRVLVLSGEPGIGKTRLLQAGVERALARGASVVRARPSEAERRVAFAALGDLFAGRHDEIGALPAPQRRALRAALLLEDASGEPPEERAIAVASLELLRRFSAGKPIVLAIDDLQWLDPPTASVLQFVFRRLEAEPVGVIATVRVGDRGVVAAFRQDEEIDVGPLSADAVIRLLHDRLGNRLRLPALRRLESASGGNPFYALELAAEVLRSGGELEPDASVRIPARLREAVTARLTRLSETGRRAALVVAALAHPTMSLAAACGADAAAVAEAVEAGILALEGEVLRFAHPLLASTLYESAPIEERRELHRALAEVVTSGEERARHLAEAAEVPDEAVAAELDAAAASLAARGAADAAARLTARALELTPIDAHAAGYRRRLRFARYVSVAGDPLRAEAQLELQLREAESGLERAEIELELGKSRLQTHGTAAARDHYRRALSELEPFPDELRLRADALLGTAHAELADLSVRSDAHVLALELAEAIGEPELLSRALAVHGATMFLFGRLPADGYWQRTLAIERETGARHYAGPSYIYALVRKSRGDMAGAAALYGAVAQSMRERGDPELPILLLELGDSARVSGDLEEASRHIDEAAQLSLLTAREWLVPECRAAQARLALLRGQFEHGRELAADALRLLGQATSSDQRSMDPTIEAVAHTVLARIELYSGRPQAGHEGFCEALTVLRRLDVAPTLAEMACEDALALVALGRLDDARTAVGDAEQLAERLGMRVFAPLILRARAAIFAAGGELETAVEHLERAVASSSFAEWPYEFGRTLLMLGTVQRRARRTREARATLQRALEVLDGIGAEHWSEQTRAELARIGGRPRTSAGLTTTEQRVADAVAAGQSNAEVARALFMSPKTVEWNLSKIYKKLQVRSRTELAAKLARPRR